MLKKELTFDVIEMLKEVIDKLQPELIQRVRSELKGRDLRLFSYVFKNYYQKGWGRYYDGLHILSGTSFIVRLEKVIAVSPLIKPKFFLHDIGYGVLTDAEKEKCAVEEKIRILHMELGAPVTMKILVQVGGYDLLEKYDIVAGVVTHDNWTLEIPARNPDDLVLIDADKIFVISFFSFYKDWIGEEGKNLSIQEFFDSRRNSFYVGIHSLSTKLAKQWRDKQFEARWQEIQSNILKNENSFRQYAEKHIRAELEV